MATDFTALYVRLPTTDAQRLDAAATATGKSKRQLVSEAVRGHLDEEGLTVGRIELRENPRALAAAPPVEVMTIEEVAEFLRVDVAAAREGAEGGTLPGRMIAGEWRFSRAALLAWLAG